MAVYPKDQKGFGSILLAAFFFAAGAVYCFSGSPHPEWGICCLDHHCAGPGMDFSAP